MLLYKAKLQFSTGSPTDSTGTQSPTPLRPPGEIKNLSQRTTQIGSLARPQKFSAMHVKLMMEICLDIRTCTYVHVYITYIIMFMQVTDTHLVL